MNSVFVQWKKTRSPKIIKFKYLDKVNDSGCITIIGAEIYVNKNKDNYVHKCKAQNKSCPVTAHIISFGSGELPSLMLDLGLLKII